MKAKPLPLITPLVAARFWSHVDVGTPKSCWVWKGALTGTGYGHFRITPKCVAYAHRISYQLLAAPAPTGFQQFDHLCRVRHCVNPAHLEIVIAQTNNLRGIGAAAKNAAKTHCPKGHPFEGENLYLKPRRNGMFARVCLVCRRAHQRVLNFKYRAPGYTPKGT